MCARCHKRIAVVFITKMENGQRTSEGLCMRCAKEVGLPVNNMLDGIAGQMGITPDQIASMEDSMNEMMAAPSESDGVEDGGAPAIDMPSLFGEDGEGMPQGMENLGKSPIIITSPIVRMYFKRMTKDYFKDLIVISYNEIDSNVELQSVGMVTV